MKEKYIARYGNAYELSSPRSRELMALFRRTCRENGILHTPDESFSYLTEFPEKYTQMSLFD